MVEEINMKNSLLIASFLVSLTAMGQDVVIAGIANREVPTAQRISEIPKIIDTVIPSPMIEYPFLSFKYDTKTEVESIEPAAIKIKDNLDQLYSSYVKVGIGTEMMPLGEVYWNNTRSRKYMYGVHAKHLSSWGNIPGYERSTFDRTGVQLFGGINEKKYQLIGDFHYRNQGLHYYAIEAPLDSMGRPKKTQRYQDIGFDALFKSDTKVDTFQIDYQIGLKYNHFNTRRIPIDSLTDWRAKENFIAVNGYGEYKLKKEIYSVGLDILHNEYNYGLEGDTLIDYDTSRVRSNTILSLKPQISTFMYNNKFKATVGLDITLDGDGVTQAHIYPIAELKYSLFNDIFIPYVGVRGGLKQGSLKSLTLQNEFIRPNVNIRNEDTAFEVYGGFKGTLSKRMSFNIGGGYARIRNKALFITDTIHSPGNKFDVIYDTLNQMTIEGSISYQALEKLKVDVIGTYRSYELLNNTHAWNLPTFQLVTRAYYSLYDKFLINLDFNLETGRRALVYTDGPGVIEENLQLFKELGAIYDFNLGLEYRYTERLSVFFQMNNIASQRYQRWYNAPVHSFQVLGGLTFRL